MNINKSVSLALLALLFVCMVPSIAAPTPVLYPEVWVGVGQPYLTISEGYDSVEPGGIIHVVGGSYFATITIDKDVTIIGEGYVTIRPDFGTPFTIMNADVIFENLCMYGDDTCIETYYDTYSGSVTLNGCTLNEATSLASAINFFFVDSFFDVTLVDCDITGNNGAGVYLDAKGSSGSALLETTSIWYNDIGVWAVLSDGSSVALTLHRNDISDNEGQGLLIDCTSSTLDLDISDDNLFQDNGDSGVLVRFPESAPSPSHATLFVEQNTFVGNGSNASEAGDGFTLYADGASDIVGTITENFFLGNAYSGIYGYAVSEAIAHLDIMFNMFLINGLENNDVSLDAGLDGYSGDIYGGAIELYGGAYDTDKAPVLAGAENNLTALIQSNMMLLNGFGILAASMDVTTQSNMVYLAPGAGISVLDGATAHSDGDLISLCSTGYLLEGERYPSSGVLTNLVIVENVGTIPFADGSSYYEGYGDGVAVFNAECIISHCNILDNEGNGIMVYDVRTRAPPDGISYEEPLAVTIVNSIVAGNGIFERSPRDGDFPFYNIQYGRPLEGEPNGYVPPYAFTILHNDVWQPEGTNNFSPSLAAYEGAFGNFSEDPLFDEFPVSLSEQSPCIDAGVNANVPAYGNVTHDFAMNEVLVTQAMAGIPGLDGQLPLFMSLSSTPTTRPQGALFDVGAFEFPKQPFSIVTYVPVVMTGLSQANALWAQILGMLPSDPTPELQALLDAKLAEAQGFIEGATQLSNPIAASGSLQRAMAILQEIQALLA